MITVAGFSGFTTRTNQYVSNKSLIGRLFAAIWSGVDGVRKILHLVLLLFIFMLFIGAIQDTPLVLPERAVLVVEPYGYLVEQIEVDGCKCDLGRCEARPMIG